MQHCFFGYREQIGGLARIIEKEGEPVRNFLKRVPRSEKQPSLRSDEFLQEAMNQWGDTVHQVAFAQTGAAADADDVYQDVFIRLLKDTTVFETDEHLKAWLLRVTINRCHDLARTPWNRRTGPLQREHASLEAPESPRSDIWELVAALPPERRAVINLFYVEGYSTNEIAGILECSPATVRTRLHRARGQLREELERQEPCDDKRRKESNRDHGSSQAYPGRLSLDDTCVPCAGASAK